MEETFGMLVLSRKPRERILIGDNIAITVVRIGPNSVRLGIDAPPDMPIMREEIANVGERSAPPLSTATPPAVVA